MDSTTKKRRLSKIGGDSSNRQPSAGALAASSPRGFDACARWTTGASPCTARTTAATTPSSAEQRKAPRHPTALCMNSSVTGGMVDRIGEAQDGEHGDEHPERMHRSRDRDGSRAQE